MNLVEANEILEQARREQKEGNLDRAIKLLIKINNSSDELQDSYARAQFKLGYLYNQLDRFAEAEQAYKNVKREDRAESYAMAQYNLGYLYNQLDRFAEAEQAYKNVKREDRAESYAMAQYNLGYLYNQLDRFAEAEQAYKNVKREDRAESYAIAQYNLGYLYNQLDRFAEAEQAYKNVKREDRAELYAIAQYNLGILLKHQDRFKEAEQAYQNVKREDSLDQYIRVQLNLGNLYSQLDRFTEAEQTYKNIKREDSLDQYVRAQLNLGNLYSQLDRFTEAEQTYKNIKREDSLDQYVRAQFNLGILLKQQDRFKEAEQAYQNVKREDSLDQYVRAQLNLGNLYNQLDRFTEAEQTYKNIKREDSLDQYVRAQFKLGYLYNQQYRFKEAEKYYKKVKRDDSKSIYAYAQFNLWALTNNKIYLKHINRSDNDEIYNEAQFQLGELEYYSEIPKLRVILDYWNNILETSEWYPKVVYKRYLINKIFNNKNGMSKKLIEIFKKVDALLNNLVVKRDHENLIAHYTSPSVAKLLIAKEVCGFPTNSKMRLNTIDLMNDPTEGEILNHYLNISSDLISTNDQAFMGCFTLHHDSLNQFRLYGKEDKKEGSGLSLILSNQFFEQENSFSHIRLQDSNNSVSESNEVEGDDISRNITKKGSVDENTDDKTILKLPLYRCIYIDPDSKLIEISHREEWTFCREEKNSKSDKWNDYQTEIIKLRDEVRNAFKNLEDLIQPLYQKIFKDLKEYSHEAELLAEILLPLRFLIKHMAFKEEQECRVVYVTQWDDDFIQYDEQLKRFYIDYGSDVVMHLKKIYLGPHALHGKNMFEYLCSHARHKKRTEHDVKIKISHNPLR